MGVLNAIIQRHTKNAARGFFCDRLAHMNSEMLSKLDNAIPSVLSSHDLNMKIPFISAVCLNLFHHEARLCFDVVSGLARTLRSLSKMVTPGGGEEERDERMGC